MANTSGNAYGLSLVCPIKNGAIENESYVSLSRKMLQKIDLQSVSPMACVPNTYLCRFYILNDVFYEGSPARDEHLKSSYLVFSSNFHGGLDEYLSGFWQEAQDLAKKLWQYCVAFDQVKDEASFIAYIKKCQLETTLFFNGSDDHSLQQQLKALYLKQQFSEFVVQHQGLSAEQTLQAFQQFIREHEPSNLAEPSWPPGCQDPNTRARRSQA